MLAFHLGGLIQYILFFRLGMNWYNLVQEWRNLENRMRGYEIVGNLRRNLNYITTIIMAIAGSKFWHMKLGNTRKFIIFSWACFSECIQTDKMSYTRTWYLNSLRKFLRYILRLCISSLSVFFGVGNTYSGKNSNHHTIMPLISCEIFILGANES